MPDLHCSVGDCAYNACDKCCNGHIQVTGGSACDCGETCCSSFCDCGGAGCQNTVPSLETSIGCNVTTCRHNENSVCSAQHITIQGQGCHEKQDTCCGSFESR